MGFFEDNILLSQWWRRKLASLADGKLYVCGFEIGEITYKDERQMVVDIGDTEIIVEKSRPDKQLLKTIIALGLKDVLMEKIAELGLDTEGWYGTKLLDDGDGLRLYMVKRLSDEVFVRVMFKVQTKKVELVKLQLVAKSNKGKDFIRNVFNIIEAMSCVRGD